MQPFPSAASLIYSLKIRGLNFSLSLVNMNLRIQKKHKFVYYAFIGRFGPISRGSKLTVTHLTKATFGEYLVRFYTGSSRTHASLASGAGSGVEATPSVTSSSSPWRLYLWFWAPAIITSTGACVVVVMLSRKQFWQHCYDYNINNIHVILCTTWNFTPKLLLRSFNNSWLSLHQRFSE